MECVVKDEPCQPPRAGKGEHHPGQRAQRAQGAVLGQQDLGDLCPGCAERAQQHPFTQTRATRGGHRAEQHGNTHRQREQSEESDRENDAIHD